MDHADTTDILKRLGDCIVGWPGTQPPSATVEVRADLVTAAYAEIERLRQHGEIDLHICRLPFPDGSVPSAVREAAVGWHHWYDSISKFNDARRRKIDSQTAEIAQLAAAAQVARNDLGQVIADTATELGCEPDNEAILAQAHKLRTALTEAKAQLDPLEGVIDGQTSRSHQFADHDLPDDDELEITITVGDERRLTRAINIIDAALK